MERRALLDRQPARYLDQFQGHVERGVDERQDAAGEGFPPFPI